MRFIPRLLLVIVALFGIKVLPGDTDVLPDCMSQRTPNTPVGPCKLKLEGAPSVYRFGKPWTDFRNSALRKLSANGPKGCATCEISFSPGVLLAFEHLDYATIGRRIVAALTASGNGVAFNGFSSGEVLVTTIPKMDGGRTSFYQVSIVAQFCNNPYLQTREQVCGVLGSAERIVLDSDQTSRTSVSDKLTQDIEALVSDYLYNLVKGK